MQEEDEHDRLSDVVCSIFYELPKLDKLVQDCLSGKQDISVLSADQKWAIFFRYRNIQKMAGLIGEICRTMFREKAAKDYNSGMYNAYQKGREEAEEKARLVIEERDRVIGENARVITELNRKLREAGKDTY